MTKEYDSTWDLEENEHGNMPSDEDSFDKISAEWKKRTWESWLRENLTFPFPVERMEDEDDAYFTDIAESKPFRLGHVMEVIDIEMEDNHYGVILKVKEGKRTGHVPLCDVEVTSRENENFWPVREYVVWFAKERRKNNFPSLPILAKLGRMQSISPLWKDLVWAKVEFLHLSI